jgi:hypothetical protein
MGERKAVGADAEVSHVGDLCRRPREPHGPPSDTHACWAPGLIEWRSRRSARWLTPASAATYLGFEVDDALEISKQTGV